MPLLLTRAALLYYVSAATETKLELVILLPLKQACSAHCPAPFSPL